MRSYRARYSSSRASAHGGAVIVPIVTETHGPRRTFPSGRRRRTYAAGIEVTGAHPHDPLAPRVTRGARLTVYGLLAAVLWCGVAQIEWWPLTSWKLFSQLRTAESNRWELAGVDDDGSERPLGEA